MAGHRSSPDDNSNLQILWVRLNGNNTTIQEALRAVDNMTRRPAPPIGNQESLPGRKQVKSLTKEHQKAPESQNDPNQFDAPDDALGGEDSHPGEENGSTSNASNTRKPRRFPTPQAISDVNFTQDVSLASLVEQKKPSSDWDRFLVIATWFKEHRQTPSITPDHIYTAYRFLNANGANWPIPKNIGSVFRDMKNKKAYWDNGEKRNWWNINHIGETRFNQLPADD